MANRHGTVTGAGPAWAYNLRGQSLNVPGVDLVFCGPGEGSRAVPNPPSLAEPSASAATGPRCTGGPVRRIPKTSVASPVVSATPPAAWVTARKGGGL